MSLPQSDPVVSAQYLQIKVPRDVQSAGENLLAGCNADETKQSRGLSPESGRGTHHLETSSSNFLSNSSSQKRNSNGSMLAPCISTAVINITPPLSALPVAGGSNPQNRDFLSDEAKQAAANLRDTRAAIADRRSMFFKECPKSPKHSLDNLVNPKATPGGSSGVHSLPLQRSILTLERNKDSHNFEVTSRGDEEMQSASIARDHPRLTPERTMSGYYFPNVSRKPGTSGRMSIKTAELIKNCPSLELYTTAPITAMTHSPPSSTAAGQSKISPPSLQMSPPPTLSFLSSEPIVLQIVDSSPSSTNRPASSSEKFMRISMSSSATNKRRARTSSPEGPRIDVAAECHGGVPSPTCQNGDDRARSAGTSLIPSSDSDSREPRSALDPHGVRFYSSPDAYPFQEGKLEVSEGHKADKMRRPSGEESLPSTPNSGSLSSSMKSASINKLKAFFSDGTSIFSSEGKQVENAMETSADAMQLEKKSFAVDAGAKLEKSSFKSKKSNSKHQQQQQLQAAPVPTQGSPRSKHKKSPTDKGEPQAHKESWKGRVARTIKRYGSGSILLTSDPGTATSAEESRPETGLFGVPLEMCEVSPNCDLVPLIVEVCVRIVEERGLDNQGIYRVPGNTGAIKELQDELNRDRKGLCLDNEKWQDVNLVTSLLKLFFRKLPDSLITDRLYEPVIATSRLEKSEKRMLKLKRIIHDMPERNFNTFAFLTKHLSLVTTHEEYNRMDAHNLAIMFGPTLIRPKDNNITVMARNMADQCRVIEMIILHCDWFFSSWDEDVNVPMDGESEESTPIIDEKMVAKAQSLALYTHTL